MIFEYLVFAAIGLAQIYFFIRTRSKIKEYQVSIPDVERIMLENVQITFDQIDGYVATGELERIEDKNGIQETENEFDYSDEKPDDPNNYHRVLNTDAACSYTFENILHSINKYLVRNTSSVADFTLIKDIVERNTDTLEEEIDLTISTPLYLGLMGTMLGIIIGLFSMSDVMGVESSSGANINILLSSVKIAMIVSCLGLFLTVINSSFTLKGSKHQIEARKNDFYTFIQVELLPTLNQGMASTFDSLQRNLNRFNERFDTNLDRLSSVFDKNYDAILLQKELIKELDRSKISEMSAYNVKVLQELNISMVQFEKFNAMFANLNGYLTNSVVLTDKTNELLERTGNFETIARSIEANVNDHKHLIRFLSTHFEELEKHRVMVDQAAGDVSYGIKDTFIELQESLQRSSQLLSEEAMKREIESKGLFELFFKELFSSFEAQAELFKSTLEDRKSSIDHLKHLEPLLNEIRGFKYPANTSPDNLSNHLVELCGAMNTTNQMLRRIETDLRRPFYKKIFNKN